MHVLIAGGDRVDAGKTTFTVGFLRWCPAAVRAFKPRAANDYWFDHDDVRDALADGRLHGSDVGRLVAADGTDAPPDRRNPIHRLWRPTPGSTGPLGERDRTALLDRVWTPDGPQFVVNETAELPAAVESALPVAEARRVDSLDAFDRAMRELHAPALDRVTDRIRDRSHAVVEAYGNVATPTDGVAYDAIAVVEPSRVRLFDGDRWAVAREAATDAGRGRREIRTDRLTEMLEPAATVRLDPVRAARRRAPAALADRYDTAYERLWRLAHS